MEFDNKVLRLDPEKEKLVVRFNCLLRADAMQKIKEDILKQVETGTVVLPPYCLAIVVNKETNIEVEVR